LHSGSDARLAASTIEYRPQIDSLRGLAVLSVLLTHFWTDNGGGHHGVRLFFVVSGFLITRILLRLDDSGPAGFWKKFQIFYVRRCLRIWPTYYLCLAIAALIDLDGIRPSLAWHLAFLSNFWFLREGQWIPHCAAHLWTLAVEEQFYLVWPLIALAVARNRLPAILIAAVVIAVATRALLWSPAAPFPDIATPASFDALGLGGLLALAKYREQSAALSHRLLASTAASSVAAFVLLSLWAPPRTGFALGDFALAITFAALVAATDRGIGGPIGRMLELKPIVGLGRVSYGVYLYHLYLLSIVRDVAQSRGVEIKGGPTLFLAMTTLTIAVAAASWILIERPLARLKRQFPYRV